MDYSLNLPNTKIEIADINGMIEVNNSTTNDSLIDHTFTIARYFKKELNYDFVPYDGIHTKAYNAFLFTEIDFDLKAEEKKEYLTVYGACLFQKTNFIKDHGERYVLRWVWIHPYFRNRGKFYTFWKLFEERFGDFYIDTPVSLDMKEFIIKASTEGFEHLQLDIP